MLRGTFSTVEKLDLSLVKEERDYWDIDTRIFLNAVSPIYTLRGFNRLKVLYIPCDGVVKVQQGNERIVATKLFPASLEELHLQYPWLEAVKSICHALQDSADGLPHLRLVGLFPPRSIDHHHVIWKTEYRFQLQERSTNQKDYGLTWPF